MTTKSRTVQATFRGQKITSALYWNSKDPYAVDIVFDSGETWTLSRDEITKAMTGGMVAPQQLEAMQITVVRSSLTTITVTHFHKTKHPVCVSLPYADVREFVDGTYEVVKPGMEHHHLDWGDLPGVTA